MTKKASLSALLLLSFGALQTLAAAPRLRLEIGADPSGCLNTTTSCSYGCGKISTNPEDKHILTPLCATEEILPDFPKRMTIRGTSTRPFLFDEDSGDRFRCRKRNAQSQTFLCLRRRRRSAKHSSKHASASVVAQASGAPSKSQAKFSAQATQASARASAQFSARVSAQANVHAGASADIISNVPISAESDTPVSAQASAPANPSFSAKNRILGNKVSSSSTPTSESAAIITSAIQADAFESQVDTESTITLTEDFIMSDMDEIMNNEELAEAFGINLGNEGSKVSAAAGKPSLCQFLPSVTGQGRGLGNLDDCCVDDDDCHGSCIDGSCDEEYNIPTGTATAIRPSPSTVCTKNSAVFGQRKGLGNLGDCCVNSNDCTGACIKGACNAENNTPLPKCIDSSYQGKRNGKGPKGVCCNTQADCRESCVEGACTAPLNF